MLNTKAKTPPNDPTGHYSPDPVVEHGSAYPPARPVIMLNKDQLSIIYPFFYGTK